MEESHTLSFVETGGWESFAEALRELGHLDSTLVKREEEENASYEPAMDEDARFKELLLFFRFRVAATNIRYEALRPTLSALDNVAVRISWAEELDFTELDALIAMTRDVEGALAPEPKKKLATIIAMLADVLLIHHLSQQRVEDLNAAIAALRRARELDPDDPGHVRLLIRALGSRARATETLDDFDEAIVLASRFAASEDMPDRDEFASLQEKYSFLRLMQSRGEGELDSFLAMSRKLSPAGVGELSIYYRAIALEDRFNHSGELYDLDLAIRHYASLRNREITGIDKLDVLDHLSWSYTRRFVDGRRFETRDIDAAIKLTLEAISMLDPKDPAHREHTLNLALCHTFRARANLPDVRTDLDKATELFLSVERPDQLGHMWYVGYAECLRKRGVHLHDTAAIHQSVRVMADCACLIPEHDQERQTVLFCLALARKDALMYDAEHRDPATPGRMIDFWCSRAKEVMMAFVDAANATCESSCWKELPITEAFSRFYATSILFMHSRERAEDVMDPLVVKDLQSRFLSRMSEVMGLGHTLSRRYEQAATLQSTVNATVATAFLLEDNDTALEWFEQGRAVVWSQIHSLRTPLDDLRARRSDLADELEKLSLELEDAGRRAPLRPLQGPSASILSSADTGQVEGKSITGRSLARKHSALLEQIRRLNGFENFLRPKSADALLKAAETRAVACINVDDSRCDALIIFRSNTHHVRLTQLTSKKVEEWHLKLTTFLRRERTRPPAVKSRMGRVIHVAQHADKTQDDPIREVLREMWTSVVWPILDVYLNNKGAGRPHITWCATGKLSFLPLHAAGPYDRESPKRPNAFDLVVSSYAPNLSTLLPPATVSDPAASPSILVVAQPNTPGVSSLPKTKKELKKIKKRFAGTSSAFLLGPQGTVPEVLKLMAKHPYIHLACHGMQDADPMNSAFILHPGLPDRKALVPDGKALVPDGKAPLPDGALTLKKLMEHKSSNAQLAFLSACETAMGDEMVPDEAVHLAAGMLAAGYKSVVATMWSIGDSEAARVADEFYKAFPPGLKRYRRPKA